MSSTSRCELLAGIAMSIAGSSVGLHDAAAEPVTITDGAYFTLTAENTASDLEVGVGIPVSGTLSLRPYGRVPFADTDAQLVRVDGHAVTAKFGLGVDYGLDQTGSDGPARFWVASAQAELGTDVYSFTPDGMPAREKRHQSFSARLLVRRGWLYTHFQWAPQLSIAYDRSYAGADAIGEVAPGMNGAPDTVRMVVVDPPGATPAVSARIGSPLYLPQVSASLAFGAYLIARATGDDRAYAPWAEGSLYRGELWGYGFVRKPAQTRIGIGLFTEWSRSAAGVDGHTVYGALAQLKFNTTLFEY